MSIHMCRLKDIAAPGGLVGGPFGSMLVSSDYVDAGIAVIRGSNMGQLRYIGGSFAYVSEAKFANDLSRNAAQPDDLIYTQRGTLGQVALVPPESPTLVVSQSQMRLRVDKAVADPSFIYYASRSGHFRRQVDDRAISTGVPHINLGILGDLEVPLPPLPEQQAIAEVLGALDDKIAANTRLAATADELIRTGYSQLTRSVDSTVPLRTIAEHVRQNVDPAEADGAYVGLEHLPRRNMWLAEYGDAADVSSTKSRFREGDVLFGKLRPYFHKVVSAPVNGVCSTDILVLRAAPELSELALAAAASDEAIVRATAASEGTRMPRAKWKDIGELEVPDPDSPRVRKFIATTRAIRSAVESAVRENRTLAATRDALLPHLMSGRIRVREIDDAVEEVGI